MTDRPVPPSLSLEGAVALVTGAGSRDGIGFAVARALGDLGARVMLTATSGRIDQRRRELGGAGIPAAAHQADLTDPDQAAVLVQETVARFGTVDIVVNNAGMVSVTGGFEAGSAQDMAVDTWRRGIARNLDTAFFVTRAALPHLSGPRGRIVMVASVTGPVMAMRDEAVYAAAKSGMVGLARSLAVDLAPRGVTSNAVAPGWIATASQTDAEAHQAGAVPLQRSATPGEVAAAVAWLCTPGAAYVTGQCLVVDGGNSVAEERAAGPRPAGR